MIALAALVLISQTFSPGATLPKSTVYNGCGGANRSPELRWFGAPRSTRSFALIVHDPDAPHTGGWYHWVAYGIPASVRQIPFGGAPSLNARAGRNDFGDRGYDGPCPPPGKPHHYRFTLYALAVPANALHFVAPPTGAQLAAAIRRYVIAQRTLTGMYAR